MLRHAQPKWTTILTLSVIVASLIALVMLVPPFISVVSTLLNPPPIVTPVRVQTVTADTATPSPALIQARAVLARVRDEIVPREGMATTYGVTFSNQGYETLMKWNEDFKAEARYADAFESLDLFMPCCIWSTPSRIEEKNCACGHHQALEGLSKKLLSDGWDSRAVQSEVTQWTRYLFPKETVRAEMENRATLDAEMKIALDELKARGEC